MLSFVSPMSRGFTVLCVCLSVCVTGGCCYLPVPQQSHPEAITFLGEGNDVSLYSIPGEMVIFSLSSSISIETVYAQGVAIIDVNIYRSGLCVTR